MTRRSRKKRGIYIVTSSSQNVGENKEAEQQEIRKMLNRKTRNMPSEEPRYIMQETDR